MPKTDKLAKRLDADVMEKAGNDDIVEKSIKLSTLTKTQVKILRAEVGDFMSESSRTVEAIAKSLDIHVNTIYHARRSRQYKTIKQAVIHELFMDDSQVFYVALIKAAESGKIGAIRLGLEIQQEYTPKTVSENVNVNVNIGDDTMTPDVAIERFLTMLGSRGYSLEMIAEIWHRLKASQAF